MLIRDRFAPRGGGFATPGGGFGRRGGGFAVQTRPAPPFFPDTDEAFRARTGLALTALYPCDETSGSLKSRIGSFDLAAVNTPTFNYAAIQRRGVYYDGANDRHAANIHDVAANSFLAFAVAHRVAAAATAGIMGRANASFAEAWYLYTNTVDDKIFYDIRGDGSNQLGLTTATVAPLSTKLTFISFQMDRTATTARGRVSARGFTPVTVSGSIAGWGSMSGASQVHALGAFTGLNPGLAIVYHGILIGAAAEGASKLADLSAALGFE